MSQTNPPSVRTIPSGTDPSTAVPRAVAVRIGERNLWLGDRGAAQPDHLEAMGLNPEYVVTVNGRRTNATTDHHPLRDGYVNDRADFTAAVETTRKRYTQSGTVLVHCAAGISRSTTVIATTLAVEEECSFGDAVAEVVAHRERARPHEKLRINALNYLATRHDRQEARDTLVDLVRRARLEDATRARALDGLDEEAREVVDHE